MFVAANVMKLNRLVVPWWPVRPLFLIYLPSSSWFLTLDKKRLLSSRKILNLYLKIKVTSSAWPPILHLSSWVVICMYKLACQGCVSTLQGWEMRTLQDQQKPSSKKSPTSLSIPGCEPGRGWGWGWGCFDKAWRVGQRWAKPSLLLHAHLWEMYWYPRLTLTEEVNKHVRATFAFSPH